MRLKAGDDIKVGGDVIEGAGGQIQQKKASSRFWLDFWSNFWTHIDTIGWVIVTLALTAASVYLAVRTGDIPEILAGCLGAALMKLTPPGQTARIAKLEAQRAHALNSEHPATGYGVDDPTE